MKKLLMLPVFLSCSVVHAQKQAGAMKSLDCATIQAENMTLKEKVIAYEARLGIGVGGVNIINGNDKLTVSFLSCKASRTTHKAVFTFMIRNTDEPVNLIIWSNQNGWGSTGSKSTFLDEQGRSYPIDRMLIGTTDVGYGAGSARIPSKAPVQCVIHISAVPLSATNLNSVLLAFGKEIPGMAQKTEFVSGFQNVPVTWVP